MAERASKKNIITGFILAAMLLMGTGGLLFAGAESAHAALAPGKAAPTAKATSKAKITTVTLSSTSKTYDGKAFKPEVTTVKAGNTTVSAKCYTIRYVSSSKKKVSSPTNAGTYYVKVSGKGSYTGTAYAKFKIKPATISKSKISEIADQVYTGKAIRPRPSVTSNATGTQKTLKNKSDYALSYSNNIERGIASVTIKGIKNYKGSTTTNFKIRKKGSPFLSEHQEGVLLVGALTNDKSVPQQIEKVEGVESVELLADTFEPIYHVSVKPGYLEDIVAERISALNNIDYVQPNFTYRNQ